MPRYYHEKKAVWPVAQSNVVETFIPTIDFVGPEMVVCPVDMSLTCSFNPFKKRAMRVTEGDSLVVSRSDTGVGKTFEFEPWSGHG